MKFDTKTGTIELADELSLHRGMTRKEILKTSATWEDWIVVEGVPHSIRTIIKLPNKKISAKTILIVHVSPNEYPLAMWDIAPWDLAQGVQNRPEGKCTKRMRKWFLEMFDVQLPCGGDWGHVDASYDPWNQSTGVICNYRDGFESEDEWDKYRKENQF